MCRGIVGIGQGLARALDGVLERLKAYLWHTMIYDKHKK